MRIFVKYNSEGEVVSVARVEIMPKNVDTPYEVLAPGESVVEVTSDAALAKLDVLEIHHGHKVDPKTKKLLKKPLVIPRPDIDIKPIIK